MRKSLLILSKLVLFLKLFILLCNCDILSFWIRLKYSMPSSIKTSRVLSSNILYVVEPPNGLKVSFLGVFCWVEVPAVEVPAVEVPAGAGSWDA